MPFAPPSHLEAMVQTTRAEFGAITKFCTPENTYFYGFVFIPTSAILLLWGFKQVALPAKTSV